MPPKSMEIIGEVNNTLLNISRSLVALNDNVSDITGLLYDIPSVISVFLTFLYALLCLSAIIGNSLVITIVITSIQMRSVTNFFVANLAVADILLAIFAVPFNFNAALLQRWSLPPFMCKLCPFVQELTVNVSVLTLIAIALIKNRAVLLPLKVKTSIMRAKMGIFIIWVLSALAAVPSAIAKGVLMIPDAQMNKGVLKPFCMNVHMSSFEWKLYNHLLVILQYVLPFCFLSTLYMILALKLRNNNTPGNAQFNWNENIINNKKKALKMVMTTFYLFLVSWTPYQLYNVLEEIFPEINRYKYINLVWFGCHWLAMCSTFCNPVVYGIYCERLNAKYKKMCKSCIQLFRCSRSVSGQHINASTFPLRYYWRISRAGTTSHRNDEEETRIDANKRYKCQCGLIMETEESI